MAVNRLSDGEDERLALLVEEMGEALQVIGKVFRHGYNSTHEDYGYVLNRHLLEKEIGHVNAALELLIHQGDINANEIRRHMFVKLGKVQHYLHHQPKEMFDAVQKSHAWEIERKVP